MTDRDDHTPPTTRQDEAIAWLMRVQGDDADWAGLTAWLEAAPGNREAFDRAERLWAELDEQAQEITAALDAEPPQVIDLAARRRTALPMRRFLAPAAVAAGVALAVVLAPLFRPAPAPSVTYVTAKSETRLVRLADGTKINLASASSLHVSLDRDARRVTMDDAEAAFDVAKDPKRPFLITAGDRTVRVVGTEFDVRRRDGSLLVTVRRGIVQVAANGAGEGATDRLTPGQQLAHREGSAEATVRVVDPEPAFAWKAGRLIYQDRPLPEVVADLNRYFAVPIRVHGDAADLRFSGVLVIDREDAVVGRLQTFLPVVADSAPDAITLRRR